MRSQQISLFKFSELSQEAQEKVLDKFRDINVNYDFWDYLEEDLRAELKAIGVEYNKVYFNFEANKSFNKYIYLNNPIITSQALFKNCLYNSDNEKIIEELKEQRQDFYFYIITENSNRNGRNSVIIVNDENTEEAEAEAYTEKLNSILNKFLKAVDEAYNYGLSDEAVKDTIEANDYEFLENGSQF